MKTYSTVLIFMLFLLWGGISQAQTPLSAKAENAIRAVMARQEKCWNEGDLECFMNGYWESDSLKFIGSSGLNRGWNKTLSNYKRSYPDKSAMGKLTFSLLSLEKLGGKHALVIGKWHLAREAGDLEGHFSLVWRKLKGEWVIVADHSS